VATEIDADSTYVGGSRSAVDAVLASSDLEALPSDVGHRFDYWGDMVNGPPPWPLREGPKSDL
jgi:hypothetical protein